MECTCTRLPLGNRYSANEVGCATMPTKEWNGILKDFYYKRWGLAGKTLCDVLDGKPWWNWLLFHGGPWQSTNPYTSAPENDCVTVAKKYSPKHFGWKRLKNKTLKHGSTANNMPSKQRCLPFRSDVLRGLVPPLQAWSWWITEGKSSPAAPGMAYRYRSGISFMVGCQPTLRLNGQMLAPK